MEILDSTYRTHLSSPEKVTGKQLILSRCLLAVLFSLFICLESHAFQIEEIPLWDSDSIPGQSGEILTDSVHNQRVLQVGMPSVFVWTPAREEMNETAVLIIPGGGYHHNTIDLSGHQIAKWFNTLGITAFVLNYRLPTAPNLTQQEIVPLLDARRAMQIIREEAEERNIDPNRIGVFGTSAGGHLTVILSSEIEADEGLSETSYIPNFSLLLSPVISMTDFRHEGSRDNLIGKNADEELTTRFSAHHLVTDRTPKTLLLHAADDTSVPPQNSLLYFEELLKHNISNSSLHIFPSGKHSIRFEKNGKAVDEWPAMSESWLREIGMLHQSEEVN